MAEEEGDDGLGEEVGYRTIEHAAERADPVVELLISLPSKTTAHHSLDITLASSHKVTLQGGCVGVAQTQHVAIVRPHWSSAPQKLSANGSNPPSLKTPSISEAAGTNPNCVSISVRTCLAKAD